MNQNDLLEPQKLYSSTLKNLFHENANDYFDNLKKESGVNEEENRLTCNKIYKFQEEVDRLAKQRKTKKIIKSLFIALGILSFIGGLIMLIVGITDDFTALLIIGIVLMILGIVAIVLPIVFINPKIKILDEQISQQQSQVNKYKKEAYAQMAPLNALFDYGIAPVLVTKTCPLIQMDKNFNPGRFYQLKEKYGFGDDEDQDESCVFVQSGTILGNPFVLQRDKVKRMVDEVYTGSITIHWTTTSVDSEGHTHTEHHSQVLTAQVTAPKPIYYKNTCLIYGNEAAPDLSFSRNPSKANEMDEKDFEKIEKKFEKELSKLQKKYIERGFTPLGDSQFEALFNALDRDNEVQFRLLFTPLARKSMLELIKSKKPYGDDFSFIKKKKLNYIWSYHSQSFDYEEHPDKFIHFDLEKSKLIFLSAMDAYFESFFYDLAPLLSIPLYQQHKTAEYIYKDVYPRNVTSFETEIMANQFDYHQFEPAENKTELILKAHSFKKSGTSDVVRIRAYGNDKITRVTIVPKMGGDGHMHDVPVTWYEYIPCQKDTMFQVQNYNGSKKDQTFKENLEKAKALVAPFTIGSGIIAQRGIFSSIISDTNTGWNSDELNKLFNNKEN